MSKGAGQSVGIWTWLRDHLLPIPIIKVRVESCGPWLALELSDLSDLRDYTEEGHRLQCKLVIRNRAWINALPDFDGF